MRRGEPEAQFSGLDCPPRTARRADRRRLRVIEHGKLRIDVVELHVAAGLAPIRGTYAPSIDPANFVAKIDNRYLPYKPGTTFHFEGVRGRTRQSDDEIVTASDQAILGVKCTVVRDTVSEHGRAIERTVDWYAQDKQGNVWYMGEDSFELKHGHFVKASDSWKSGVNGAKPGIIMPAQPTARRRVPAGVLPAR